MSGIGIGFAIMESCPFCETPYRASGGIGSHLGSRTYICQSCGQPFRSNRQEWAEMSRLVKMWYCLISLVYMVFLGYFGSVVCKGIVQFFAEGPASSDIAPEGMLFWFGAVLIAGAVAVLQSLRIVWSLRRTRGLDPPNLVASFWSWQTNLQMLSGLGLFASLMLAWLLSWLIDRMT